MRQVGIGPGQSDLAFMGPASRFETRRSEAGNIGQPFRLDEDPVDSLAPKRWSHA